MGQKSAGLLPKLTFLPKMIFLILHGPCVSKKQMTDKLENLQHQKLRIAQNRQEIRQKMTRFGLGQSPHQEQEVGLQSMP